jgi:hypothetical protein
MDHFRTMADHLRTASDHFRIAADHFRTAAGHFRTAAGHFRTAADHFRTATDHFRTAADHFRTMMEHNPAQTSHLFGCGRRWRGRIAGWPSQVARGSEAPGIPGTPGTAAPAGQEPTRSTKHWNLRKKDRLAIEGHDPVAYVPEGGGKPIQGDEKITHQHKSALYRFASAANRDLFIKDPAKYEPAHGGWCSWAMLDGDKVEVDPKSAVVKDGRLFLFFKGWLGDTKAKWLKGNHAEQAAKADAAWLKISGETARRPTEQPKTNQLAEHQTMPTTRSKPALIASWIAQVLAAVIMGQTLFFKFSGADEPIDIFTTLGVEPWGRFATAIMELVAVVLLLVPRTAWLGGALTIGLMLGAVGSHLTKLGTEVKGDGGLLFAVGLVALVCGPLVVWLRRATPLALLSTWRAKR